jgi:hypothetical protein
MKTHSAVRFHSPGGLEKLRRETVYAPKRDNDEALIRVHAAGVNLSRRKGVLSPGSEAERALIDAESRWMVKGSDSFTKVSGTAYEGFKTPARVRRTLFQGHTVLLDDAAPTGRILAKPGSGDVIRPTPSSAAAGQYARE